jgi:hypothetical protein
VEREPLGGAVADAGELAQLGDQALDGRGEQGLPLLAPRGAVGRCAAGKAAAAAETAAEAAQPAEHVHRRRRVHPARAGGLALQVHRLAQRLVDGRQDHVLEHLDVLRVDRVGVDGERLELEVQAVAAEGAGGGAAPPLTEEEWVARFVTEFDAEEIVPESPPEETS